MTGARKLALAAGVAMVGVAGWALVAGASEPQQGHGQPAQAHPGQPVARTGAPRAGQAGQTSAAHPSGHGGSAQAHQPAQHEHAPAHAAAQPTTPDANHASAASSTTAPEAPAAGSQDALVPTYFGVIPDAETALSVLKDGNARWVSGHPQSPGTDEATRRQTAFSGQHPFAAVLACADSRVPVERVFDRGVGELFVVRVAGNVVSPSEAGSLEYAVEHLHTPVVVVMGHTGCGAVTAACAGGEAPGNLRFIIGEITPAVRRAATLHPSARGDELVGIAVRENVMQSMFDLLASSDTLRSAVDRGDVHLVGAIYDLSTGKVEWIGEHPWQDGLISVMNERGAAGSATPRNQATAEVTGGREGR